MNKEELDILEIASGNKEGFHVYEIDMQKALKHLLQEYKKLQEENENLILGEIDSMKFINKCINKDKIREKIEYLYKQDKEWSDELSEPLCDFKVIDKNLKRIKIQIDILKELLEDK